MVKEVVQNMVKKFDEIENKQISANTFRCLFLMKYIHFETVTERRHDVVINVKDNLLV